MTGKERRIETRFDCDLEVQLLLGDQEAFPTRTLDISYAGICLSADREVQTGSSAQFQLRVKTPRGTSDTLELDGIMVWCTKIKDRFQIGAQFDSEMSPAQWRGLGVIIGILRGEISLPE